MIIIMIVLIIMIIYYYYDYLSLLSLSLLLLLLGIEANEKHHYLARALWSSLRRYNLHAQIAREKEKDLPIKEQPYYYDK